MTIIIVAIVIVIRCRKCGGGEVNRIASRSRHDGSNTAELLNTSATSQVSAWLWCMCTILHIWLYALLNLLTTVAVVSSCISVT